MEIRVDLYEQKLIKIKAKECGLNVSDYLRRTALGKILPKNMTQEETQIYQDLKKFYTNFNSIGNLFKKGEYPTLLEEINQLKEQLKEHLNYIKNGK